MTHQDQLEPLAKEFEAICKTLMALAKASPAQIRQAPGARQHLENAALALLGDPEKKEQPKWWLRQAAMSLSPALVQRFETQEPGTIHVVVGSFPWQDVAKYASAEHLEAIHASGINMIGAHGHLFERAMTKKGASIQPFLEAHIKTVWNKSDMISSYSTAKLMRQPQFVARYLEAAKTHHYADLQWWMGSVMRALSGRDMLILHCLGVEPRNDEFIPDFARRAFEGHSAHRLMQIEGWKLNLADLIANRTALDWAEDHLAPVI